MVKDDEEIIKQVGGILEKMSWRNSKYSFVWNAFDCNLLDLEMIQFYGEYIRYCTLYKAKYNKGDGYVPERIVKVNLSYAIDKTRQSIADKWRKAFIKYMDFDFKSFTEGYVSCKMDELLKDTM